MRWPAHAHHAQATAAVGAPARPRACAWPHSPLPCLRLPAPHLDGLAEAHLVGENAAPEPAVLLLGHPVEALALERQQRRREVGGLLRLGEGARFLQAVRAARAAVATRRRGEAAADSTRHCSQCPAPRRRTATLSRPSSSSTTPHPWSPRRPPSRAGAASRGREVGCGAAAGSTPFTRYDSPAPRLLADS